MNGVPLHQNDNPVRVVSLSDQHARCLAMAVKESYSSCLLSPQNATLLLEALGCQEEVCLDDLERLKRRAEHFVEILFDDSKLAAWKRGLLPDDARFMEMAEALDGWLNGKGCSLADRKKALRHFFMGWLGRDNPTGQKLAKGVRNER